MLDGSGHTFDAYAESVREVTQFYLILMGPPITGWSLSWCPLDQVVLQFGTQGGAKIAHGVTRPDATTFMFQTTQKSGDTFFDGQILAGQDTIVIPPNSHFSIMSRTPLEWISISIPSALLDERAVSGADYSALVKTRKTIFTLSSDGIARLANAATTARINVQNAMVGGAPCDRSALDFSLLGSLNHVLSDRIGERNLPGNRMEATERLMSRALEYVRSHPSDRILVDDLAAVAGVNERTLLRAFRQYFAMGPKHYLKLRQLNLVRRALRESQPCRVQVTAAMSQYGVTEFGRFSVEYKQLFEESPSDTLRRSNELVKEDGAREFGGSAGDQSLDVTAT